MGETARVASTAVNGNTHIKHVLDFAEEVVEILVGHLVGQVTDEESLAGRVARSGRLSARAVCALDGVLNGETAAFEDLVVEAVKGLVGG